MHLLDAKYLDSALPNLACTITHADNKKKIFAIICIERENCLEENLRLSCVLKVKKLYISGDRNMNEHKVESSSKILYLDHH